MEATHGKLIVLCGPSGVGKSTIVHALIEQYEQLTFAISATSRPQRPGEQDGVDYHFLSPEEFRSRIDEGAFVEWEEVYPDTYYGTLRSELQRIWQQGGVYVADVDVKGAYTLKETFPTQSLVIFIAPPSVEELAKRLQARRSENKEKQAERMKRVREEMTYQDAFDAVVINDNLEAAIAEVSDHVAAFLTKTE